MLIHSIPIVSSKEKFNEFAITNRIKLQIFNIWRLWRTGKMENDEK